MAVVAKGRLRIRSSDTVGRYDLFDIYEPGMPTIGTLYFQNGTGYVTRGRDGAVVTAGAAKIADALRAHEEVLRFTARVAR